MSQQPAKIPDTVAPRRFEYADDKSYKFWTIALNGLRLTTRYGRIGHQGQTREVRFDSAEQAKRSYLQRIQQKTRAGYEERIPGKKKKVTSEDAWDKLADHEPFIQAILDEPDEVTPYAVYADWLIEQEDPRGEYTRLQLALEDPSLPMYRRPKLEKSSKLIRQQHVRKWLGNLAPWLMDSGLAAYPYGFYRGQLASIACHTLSYRFAHELKRSPQCRLLRELYINTAEVLAEQIEIDGQRYEAHRDYGIEPLIGGDFGNLRELRIAMIPDAVLGGGPFPNTSRMVEWIATMPRLERLWARAEIDIPALLKLPLPNLVELHVNLNKKQVIALAESGLVKRLNVLGIMNAITDDLVDALLRIPEFSQLTQFACHELSNASENAVERLKETGVIIDVMNFPD